MDEFFVNQTENEYFRVEMFAPLSEIMPNLDANGIYTIEVHIDNTQYRSCAAYFDGAIVQPLSLNGTTGGQIRSASDKYFEFVDYTGAAIQAMTVNGKLKLDIRFNKAVKTPYSSDLQIVKIKVIRKYPNTQVALAKRDEAAYTYGFNGYERDDEVKGSGNSYDFGARIYDPRIGRFLSIDPKYKSYPYWSPYLFGANNPIRFIDIYGEGPYDKVKEGYDRLTSAEKGVIFRPQATAELTVVRASYILSTLYKNRELAEASTAEKFGDNFRNDESDAYRHALFNALNTQSLGKELAKELSDAHEAIDDPLEKAAVKGEIEMDKHNNAVGHDIGENNPDASFETTQTKVLGALMSGKLKAFDNPRDNTKGLNPTKGTQFMKPMPTLKPLSIPSPEVKQDNTRVVTGG